MTNVEVAEIIGKLYLHQEVHPQEGALFHVDSSEVEPITLAPPTFGTANAAGQVVLAANANRRYACIVLDNAGDVFLGLGANPAVGSGILLSGKGSSYEITPQNLFQGDVYARRGAAPDKNLTITEGT